VPARGGHDSGGAGPDRYDLAVHHLVLGGDHLDADIDGDHSHKLIGHNVLVGAGGDVASHHDLLAQVSTEETSQRAGDSGLGPVIEFVTRVLAPAGLLTAVLYYFGYVREQALFAYFGVDLGSVGFSTTDYLVRSAGTVFLPLATVLVAGVTAVIAHHLLGYLLTSIFGAGI
jgi:hypothetical protein